MKDILPELNGKEYIQALNQDYDIRFCNIDEVDQLIAFLKENWKENHIFVLDRKLFDWQHLNKKEHRYNYVLAKSRVTGEIHSVLGFVPTNQFDSAIEESYEVWPCIWKSRDDVHIKGLGVSLYYYLKENLPIETISILGISEVALSIYKHWNFSTGKVKQFYIPNSEMRKFFLMENVPLEQIVDKQTNIYFNECDEDDFKNNMEIASLEINKYKSLKFYINRYYKHPTYKYTAYKIIKQGKIKLVLFTRENFAENSKCIRIVDYVGNIKEIEGSYSAVQKLLHKNNYEYLDFVNVGISKELLTGAGFLDRDDSNVIIPNYFEPYLKENISLDYAFKTVSDSTEGIFVKGDSDQDRPNVTMSRKE